MEKMKRNIRLTTMQLLAVGFMGIILIGAVLLWLPVCNTKPISFIDALFTATSGVCVTGLVTITPATQFTVAGKAILLLLIQIGGLGVIVCMTAFFLMIRKKITMRERIYIQQTYNMDTLEGMVRLIIWVMKVTFAAEGIGAILYSIQFIPQYGLVRGTCFSVFHSISAFCNAGFDILGSDSFIRYVSNPLVNFTTMGLIISGGLGFIVWSDLFAVGKKCMARKATIKWGVGRLSLHSKLAILMTAILIISGTIYFFTVEYSNPGTMGNLSVPQKLMASLFHSVSTRTAGFASVPQDALTNSSLLVTCVLMFIGGSPAGTAGGVKTTTIAMLVAAGISVIRGKRDTECFGRRISLRNIMTGLAVVMSAFIFLLAGTIAVTTLEPDVSFIQVLYETTSAIGTVGLSANLTPHLSEASKYVIIALMYIGRLGPMSLALVFAARQNPLDKVRRLPEKRILVG